MFCVSIRRSPCRVALDPRKDAGSRNFCLVQAGFSALHLAAQNGHNQSARILLYAGASPDHRNNVSLLTFPQNADSICDNKLLACQSMSLDCQRKHWPKGLSSCPRPRLCTAACFSTETRRFTLRVATVTPASREFSFRRDAESMSRTRCALCFCDL